MSANKSNADEAAWIRELASILKETGLTEVEIERDGFRVRVSRGGTAQQVIAPMVAATETTAAPQSAATAKEEAAVPSNAITSPMVGTIYLAASPEADPFVAVGTKVKKGQTLMIVEAMKTMNPIPSPTDGTISAILVDDAQPVEFGEALIVVE